MKGLQAIRKASNHLKRTSSTSQHDEFFIVFFFVGYFFLFLIRIHRPNQLNPYPIYTDFFRHVPVP
jgi:hypothetical protein